MKGAGHVLDGGKRLPSTLLSRRTPCFGLPSTSTPQFLSSSSSFSAFNLSASTATISACVCIAVDWFQHLRRVRLQPRSLATALLF